MDLILDGILPIKPIEEEIPVGILGNNLFIRVLHLEKNVSQLEYIKNLFRINRHSSSKFTKDNFNSFFRKEELENLYFYYNTKLRTQDEGLENFFMEVAYPARNFKSQGLLYTAINSILYYEDNLGIKHLVACITINKKYINSFRKRVVKRKLFSNKWFTIFIDNRLKDTPLERKIQQNPLYNVLKVVYTNSIHNSLFPTNKWQLTKEDKDTILNGLSSTDLEL